MTLIRGLWESSDLAWQPWFYVDRLILWIHRAGKQKLTTGRQPYWVWSHVTFLTTNVCYNLERTDFLHRRQNNKAILLPPAWKLSLNSLVSDRLFNDTHVRRWERESGHSFVASGGNVSKIDWLISISELLIDLFFPRLISIAKLLTKWQNRVGFWGV